MKTAESTSGIQPPLRIFRLYDDRKRISIEPKDKANARAIIRLRFHTRMMASDVKHVVTNTRIRCAIPANKRMMLLRITIWKKIVNIK